MRLVQYKSRVGFQGGVQHDLAQKHAIRQKFDARALVCAIVKTHVVPNEFANLPVRRVTRGSHLFSYPMRNGYCSHTSRLRDSYYA